MAIMFIWHGDHIIDKFCDKLMFVNLKTNSKDFYYSKSLGFWFFNSVIMFSSKRRVVIFVVGSEKYLSNVDSSIRSQIIQFKLSKIYVINIRRPWCHNKRLILPGHIEVHIRLLFSFHSRSFLDYWLSYPFSNIPHNCFRFGLCRFRDRASYF